MKKFDGNSKVRGGFYFHRKSWDLVTVSGKAGVLPGTTSDQYLKVPLVLMLLGAPVFGATLVMFLPFVGIALFVHAIAKKVLKPFGAGKLEEAPARVTR